MKLSKLSLALCLFGATALAVGGAASASTILINGSFEDGVPDNKLGLDNHALFGNLNTSGPSYDRWKKLIGWRTVAGPGIEVQTNRTLPQIDAQDGTHYVELDSTKNSAMAQTVSLKAGSYLLSFWYSPRTADTKTNGIEYRIGNLFGGKVNNGDFGAEPGRWVEVTSRFVVKKGADYELRFDAVGKSDGKGGLLDSVDVAPVPLPAAGLGLLAALAGLAGLRLRRRA